MKLLLAQPALPRFQWELEVLLTNLQQFGKLDDVILLFNRRSDSDLTVPPFLYEKYGVQSFVFKDGRPSQRYIPSIRPYLLWQFFLAHPEFEQEQFFYIDSDIIFREWPDFATLPFDSSKVYGADVNSYIGAEYILNCEKGPQIAQKMAEVCGITVDQMRGVPGIGAQLVLNGTTAAFWERVYDDCIKLYDYMLPLTTNIQKWTAEMWAQEWGWVREGKTLMYAPELKHCTPTDPIEKWDEVKILHNAGVTHGGEYFYKGMFQDRLPWGLDWSAIDRSKATYKYVEAIEKVVH